MTVEVYECQKCGDVAQITVTPTFTLNSVKCLICKGNRIYKGIIRAVLPYYCYVCEKDRKDPTCKECGASLSHFRGSRFED